MKKDGKVLLSLTPQILEDLDTYCARFSYERSEFMRKLIRDEIYGSPLSESSGVMAPIEGFPMVGSSTVEQSPVKVEGPSHPLPAKPEHLWDDYNLMPVYKERLAPGYCVEWHGQGVQRPLYEITKFRPDGTIDKKGKYCKECIKKFLKDDGHLE